MLTIRPFLFASLVVLMGFAGGCNGKGEPMKNMIVETGRSQDTRPIPINRGNTSKFIQAEPQGGPAPPPIRKP